MPIGLHEGFGARDLAEEMIMVAIVIHIGCGASVEHEIKCTDNTNTSLGDSKSTVSINEAIDWLVEGYMTMVFDSVD